MSSSLFTPPSFLTLWDALAEADEVADTVTGLLEMEVSTSEMAENLQVLTGRKAERATRLVLQAMKSDEGRSTLRSALAAR
jgi:hypothetical protein